MGGTTPEPFNCENNFATWQASWSHAKRQWCCQMYNRGCTSVVKRYQQLPDEAKLGAGPRVSGIALSMVLVVSFAAVVTAACFVRVRAARGLREASSGRGLYATLDQL